MAKYKIEDGVSIIPEGTVKIEDSAFSGLEWLDNEELTKVVIPNTVKEIGDCSFFDCKNLTSITIPQGVTSIGEYAFYETGLLAIEIPKSLEHTARSVFMGCGDLKTVTFEAGTTKIADNLFNYCDGIEEIIIPDTITTIL